MLNLIRKALRHGPYRSAALAVLRNGEVLGEIIVLDAGRDRWSGAAQVQLGFNFPDDIKIVRADAVDRPQGPSHEWLREREQWFGEGRVDEQAGGQAWNEAWNEAAYSTEPAPANDAALYAFRTSPLGPADSHASSPAPRASLRRRWER